MAAAVWSRRVAGVLSRELVAARAVCLFALGLPRVAAPHVLDVRDRLEVRRIHAGVITADVIELETLRHRADKQLVAHDVREPTPTLMLNDPVAAL
jgi:hypothetical protein